MSIFLLGCWDPVARVWCTVCKVGNGLTDEEIGGMQKHFAPLMQKISRDPSRVPDWLRVKRPLVPDFVISDPKARR